MAFVGGGYKPNRMAHSSDDNLHTAAGLALVYPHLTTLTTEHTHASKHTHTHPIPHQTKPHKCVSFL